MVRARKYEHRTTFVVPPIHSYFDLHLNVAMGWRLQSNRVDMCITQQQSEKDGLFVRYKAYKKVQNKQSPDVRSLLETSLVQIGFLHHRVLA